MLQNSFNSQPPTHPPFSGFNFQINPSDMPPPPPALDIVTGHARGCAREQACSKRESMWTRKYVSTKGLITVYRLRIGHKLNHHICESYTFFNFTKAKHFIKCLAVVELSLMGQDVLGSTLRGGPIELFLVASCAP